MPRTVRAALLQTDWAGDKESMIDKHEAAARDAAAEGAEVICFQELFYGPYFCQVQDTKFYDYTEQIPDGPTTQRFQSIAKELGMVMVLPMYEIVQAGVYYNTAAVIDADGTLPRQVPQAAHPPGQGVLGEVLLPSGQRGIPDLRHGNRQGRRVHLLRPALPRGLAGPRAERRRDRVQPVGHAPRAVRVHLARRAAGGGGRQHVLRRSDQSRRHRGRHRRQRLLRAELLRRPRGQVRRRRRRSRTSPN